MENYSYIDEQKRMLEILESTLALPEINSASSSASTNCTNKSNKQKLKHKRSPSQENEISSNWNVYMQSQKKTKINNQQQEKSQNKQQYNSNQQDSKNNKIPNKGNQQPKFDLENNKNNNNGQQSQKNQQSNYKIQSNQQPQNDQNNQKKKRNKQKQKQPLLQNNEIVDNQQLTLEPNQNTYKGVTPILAVDCEMVMCKGPYPDPTPRHELARVSIVNYNGHTLLDSFVKPQNQVINYLTWVSGVTAWHLKSAPTFSEIKAKVLEIFQNRIIVGHSVINDFQALDIYPSQNNVRDISKMKVLQNEGKIQSLKKMALKYLNIDFQNGSHSSVDDARATMLLYKKFKNEIEQAIKNQNYSNVKNMLLQDIQHNKQNGNYKMKNKME